MAEKKCVDVLVEAGADVNPTDKSGETALMMAAAWRLMMFA